MKRMLKWFGSGLLVLLVLLFAGTLSPRFWAVLSHLPFGWWHFLRRNLGQLTWNWSVIGMGVGCSVLLVVLGNGVMGKLYCQFQQLRCPGHPPKPWRWKWTVSLYLSVWLLFAIAFGAAGMFRQATWLLDEKGSWYHERLHVYLELNQAELAIRTLMLDTDDDLEATHKALHAERSPRDSKRLLCDQFDVILYANRTNKVEAFVVIPRDAELVKQKVFLACEPDKGREHKPLAKLEGTLAGLEAKYPRRKLYGQSEK